MDLMLRNRFRFKIESGELFGEFISLPQNNIISNINWDRYVKDVPVISQIFNDSEININNFKLNYLAYSKFPDIQVTCLVLDEGIVKAVKDWYELIFDLNGIGFYNDYAKFNIVIELLDLNLETRYRIKFYDAYPNNIHFDLLNHASADIYTLNLSFNYNYSKIDTVIF